jgi:hypothetical protein
MRLASFNLENLFDRASSPMADRGFQLQGGVRGSSRGNVPCRHQPDSDVGRVGS